MSELINLESFSMFRSLKTTFSNLFQNCDSNNSRRSRQTLSSQAYELLQPRALLAGVVSSIADGAWNDPATWAGSTVPDETNRVIISSSTTVTLDGTDHQAEDLVVHGELNVAEDVSGDTKTLTTRWIHVNSGGLFKVGDATDRYDDNDFVVTLTGIDVDSDHQIPTAAGGTMNVMNNDGFLMTDGEGRIEFYGEDKLSFTKLNATAEAGATMIAVDNIIERNYDKGAMDGEEFVTSAGDDGIVNWQVGDQIVIASSSYDYMEEDVRTITAIVDNGTGTSTLTLDEALDYRHYGEIEVYGETENAEDGTTASVETRDLDMRAEVALLSRNVKFQGTAEQDTDNDTRRWPSPCSGREQQLGWVPARTRHH